MTGRRFRVRRLFPGDGPPLSDAVVTIESGRIAAIDDGSRTAAIDLGNVALVPRLVNAHTHLEFSDLIRPVEPRDDFARWIREVIAVRGTRTAATAETVDRGFRESALAGVQAIGEIATSNWPAEFPQAASVAARADIELVVFREILGLREDRIEEQLRVARGFLELAASAGTWQAGISPHAPYSLHPRLFQGLCDLAAEYQVPTAMHLAESTAELELLDRGTGPLVELFRSMGLWQESPIPPGSRPLDYLRELAKLPRALVVHGNLLNDGETAFIADHPCLSVVYCPRTHAAMGHPPHPWRRMLDAGINVAIGTDSRASNPNLSVWEELRFLHAQHPELLASDLLRLATANGAKALGLSRSGTIAPGEPANLLSVPLPDDVTVDPEVALFRGSPRPFPGTAINPE